MSADSTGIPEVDETASTPTSVYRTDNMLVLPCVHCGEPTDCTPEQDTERVFCCNGCQGAYDLIHGWGLGDFYALRDQMKQSGAANAAGDSARYEQFDSSDFLGASAPIQNQDGTCSAELAVHGLHCAACAWLIENAIVNEEGLLSARVKMSQHTVQIVYNPDKTRLSSVARFFDRLGYQLAPFDPSRDGHIQTENRRLLIQISIAAFLAANAMWIAIALYAGDASGVAADQRYFLCLVGTALGIGAVAGPGRTFFVGAIAALRTWTPHMDLPVAMGLSVGSVVGVVNAILGAGHVYFDSLAVLVFLLLVGRWIQFRQQQNAARSVDLMLRITPRHAELERSDGSYSSVLVDHLSSGDTIRVSAGESVAADGEIISGNTTLDTSLLTGESLPVAASVGCGVSSGTVNLSAPIRLRVTATGRESRIGRVMQSVEEATTQRTPIVMLADRIGGYFVATVTTLATVTFFYWLTVDVATATSNATALLIVACPCALALATPLAIAVSLGRAARNSIFIRDGSSFQSLARPGQIWLDKTGTLTEGRQRVTSVIGSLPALRLAAILESGSSHPIAKAIMKSAKQHELDLDATANSLRALQGGLVGVVEGKRVCVGNLELMQAEHNDIGAEERRALSNLAQAGESPLLISVDSVVVTVVGISDPLRSGARSFVQQLRKLGWQVGILSGDHPEIVNNVGKQLTIAKAQCFGGLAPEEKLAAIRESKAIGRSVAMVGDGANDAAALATADVGIAVRGGAEVSLQAAPVFVATGSLGSIIGLLNASKRTTRLILATFAVSLSYNVLAVALAMAGWISPLAAAILMPISSVSVLAITLLARTFREDES